MVYTPAGRRALSIIYDEPVDLDAILVRGPLCPAGAICDDGDHCTPNDTCIDNTARDLRWRSKTVSSLP